MMILLIRVILSDGLYLKACQDKKKSMATAAFFPEPYLCTWHWYLLYITLNKTELVNLRIHGLRWFMMVDDC
jgi:hypothetical protein